ncbi:MAG: PQQ-dependent sugar dehydrogenase [Novosphingobium sp.]|nr:PQQ-dependent sugar dehydrogenase [Novosphingobium sp.]
MPRTLLLTAFSSLALTLASCGSASTGDKTANAQPSPPASLPASETFALEAKATFNEPWAMAFAPGTDVLFVTEKGGAIRGLGPDGKLIFVNGAPDVDYGGQGGLGDIAFLQSEAASTLTPRTIYLTWAEAGPSGTRGAALGRGRLVCEDHQSCDIRELAVIWRQQPKVSGRGHYSHRIAFSPDERYLFVASGERQKQDPAQDLSNTLGTIVRLLPDGTPAPGNPFADRGSPSDEIWSYGHRNILGLKFDAQGRPWDLEHGPAGGDELNLVRRGANYGWPLVSNGNHYGGQHIPDHDTRPDLAAPAISWNPVIAPGDMVFYTGDQFPEWRGQVLIAAMKPAALVRVAIDGDAAREVARYPMEHRVRSIAQGPDGAIWLIEDGRNVAESRLLKLTPRQDSAPR